MLTQNQPDRLALLIGSPSEIQKVPAWLALRISYGMNGVVIRNADMGSLLRYLRAGHAEKPPDILWQQWAVGNRKEAVRTPCIHVSRDSEMARLF